MLATPLQLKGQTLFIFSIISSYRLTCLSQPHTVNFLPAGATAKAGLKPCRINVITAIIGESLRITPISVHHVDVPVPIPIRHEGNAFTIRVTMKDLYQKKDYW